MNNKLNVLFLTEFSQSSSGYSKLGREMLSRLKDKYNVFELAGYCHDDDPRIPDADWKVYPTMPGQEAKLQEIEEYKSHPENGQGGRWRFNDVCLDCQPDVVIIVKDAWYETFAHYFPFRHLYNLIWWNPVDGYPLEPEWIGAAIDADACFTYTDWGYNVLKEACGNKGNIVSSMPLGVNEKDLYPIFDKAGIKKHFGFKDDTLITGFIARNQPRKLIAALVESFSKFLSITSQDVAAKSFLYLHTSWPDMSWNIPQLLKDYGVGNKVLFTYQCKNCKAVYPTIYSDIGSICKECHQNSAATSRSSDGVPEDQMNLIYNFMDVYVQLSTNEGFGLPAAEAIMCAVPTLVTDYSGTCEMITYADAIPIKSLKLYREMESNSNRYQSMPDTDLLAQQLHDLLSLPSDLRRVIGHKQYMKGRQRFSWDVAADILMKTIDKMPKKNWKSGPYRIHKANLNIPEDLSHEEMVYWLCNHVIGRPELFNRYNALKQTYELMMQVQLNKPNFRHYVLEDAIRDALGDNAFYNEWEQKRAKKFGVKL